ncbi:MAG: hypothetical protein WCK34_03860 [Bacteroidota bacterium]
MRRSLQMLLLTLVSLFITQLNANAQGPLDPVKLGTWTINIGIGSGAHYFGNGLGIGPAEKISCETGMWDVGPGVITLGGEFTCSSFWHHFGDGWKESWTNFFVAARSAYHYGWDVDGLDTYGGIPVGIGFCAHTLGSQPGNHGYTPVYPYFGFFVGASYFFTKTIGINGELGYNSTQANIGVIIKLK